MRGMGKANRERRKAKQAARRRARRSQPTGGATRTARSYGGQARREHDLLGLAQMAVHSQGDDRLFVIDTLLAETREPRDAQAVGEELERLLTNGCAAQLDGGWGPNDLWQVARRQAGAKAASLVAGVLAHAILLTTDPSNRSTAISELERLDSGTRIEPAGPRWREDVVAITDAAQVVWSLPRIPVLDDASRGSAVPGEQPENAALLAKIRALLAKAESTEFTEEADAFTLKASELMTRHRIDRAAVDSRHAGTRKSGIVSRRIWLEDPYLRAKGLLLSIVADANGCSSVRFDLGFSIVVGRREDIDFAEVLFTSLLVQATRQMTIAGTVAPRRTSAFRRSFLLAFATRIEERLKAANRAMTDAATGEIGDSFLPVLARQREEVEDAIDRMVGRKNLRKTRFSASDGAGWRAGTTAADLADIGARAALDDRIAR